MMTAAMALRRVTGELYRGIWHDIGTLERLETIRGLMG
jgi:NDP-sugar pyrophosphorylase family protein